MAIVNNEKKIMIEKENHNKILKTNKKGIFMNDEIFIIDIEKLAQYCCKTQTSNSSIGYICNKDSLYDKITVELNQIYKKAKDNIIEKAFDNINDDKDIKWR